MAQLQATLPYKFLVGGCVGGGGCVVVSNNEVARLLGAVHDFQSASSYVGSPGGRIIDCIEI